MIPGLMRVLPVCNLTSTEEAMLLGTALVAGGMPIAEVTLRHPTAIDSLRAISAVPGLTVGAGTVRTVAQLDAAIEAGAQFAVSPCLTPSLAAAVRSTGIPFLPGVTTATEIQLAVDAGFSTVKFFPAEASGGVRALQALTEVFAEVSFVPTGGITADSAGRYLVLDRVIAVGGSWMLPRQARAAGDWDTIRQAIAASVQV